MRWFIAVVLTASLVLCGLAWLFSRSPGGAGTMPPEWPLQAITVPAGATDVHFDPSLRSPVDALFNIMDKVDRQAGSQSPLFYSVAFNSPDPMNAVFDHFERQLLAAGYSFTGGREEKYLAETGLCDRAYSSPDGSLSVLVRYWASAPVNYGGKARAQHWTITITPR